MGIDHGHRSWASMQCFGGADPDEHALALRNLLAPALEAHGRPNSPDWRA
jgi:hypothetical protein